MQSTLTYAASLRLLLRNLESDAGLAGLPDKERDMLYAIVRLEQAGSQNVIRSDALRRHPLCAPMSHPTYHRTLRALLDSGLLIPAPGARNGAYSLAHGALARIAPGLADGGIPA